MSNSLLQLGDKILVVGAPNFGHVGIVIDLPLFGSAVVAHNQKGRGVEFVSLEEFAAGRAVKVISRVTGGPQVRREMVTRARSLAGCAYDLVTFNCEHYANYVQTGVASSPQVQAGFAVAAVLLGLVLLSEG